MKRRLFVASSLAATALGWSGTASAKTEWDAWADLLNMLPGKGELDVARGKRGTEIVDYEVQRIEKANSKKINFDFYVVDVETLPPGTQSAVDLLAHVRKNLNSFFDQEYSEFKAYTDADGTDWSATNAAPLGAIMQFDIPAYGLEEQAAVVASASTESSWIFTPVTIGSFSPGEHPVSGNREFGLLKKDGLATRIYTRGADRALAGMLDPNEDTVYTGADKLWQSFQRLVAAYVINNGGKATVGTRVVKQPLWSEVKASGLFTRT